MRALWLAIKSFYMSVCKHSFHTESSRGVLPAINLAVTQFFLKFVLSTVMEEEDFPNFSQKEFNFPSIQETAEKPNEQQQEARRFPSLQEEALSLVINL